MLPYRKTQDPLFKSLPVSRINSSLRLNQLSTPNQPAAGVTSIPTTPLAAPSSTHVSSLNPIRNLPITSGNENSKIRTKEELDRFEKLPIVEKVNEFESLLNSISNDISQFRDEEIVNKVKQIIQVNDILKLKIEDLDKHRQYSYQAENLSQQNKTLDEKSKHILKELIKYRNELRELPRLPTTKKSTMLETTGENCEIADILKYAMKLAKFTKAPATMGNMPFQIHPNNYIWPAEDALRRGMLAMSSLQADEIIKNELGDEVTEESEKQDEEIEMKPEPEEEQAKAEDNQAEPAVRSRRGSYVYGEEVPKKKEEQTTDLNLDLFDPDDEYSD